MISFLRNTFAFILALSLLGWFLLHSNYVQDPLKKLAKTSIEQSTGLKTEIGSISFSIPANIIAYDVSISDPKSPNTPLVTAETLTLAFAPANIADGKYIPTYIQLSNASSQQLPPFDALLIIEQNGSAFSAITTLTPKGSLPIELNTIITWEPEHPLRFEEIRFTAPGTSASGALKLLPGNLIHGDIQITCEDIGHLKPWIETDLEGKIEGTLTFRETPEQTIEFTLTSNALRSDSLKITNSKLTGSLKPPFDNPAIDLHLNINEVVSPNFKLANIALSTIETNLSSDNPFSLQFDLSLYDSSSHPLHTSGTWSLHPNNPSIEVAIQTLDDSTPSSPYTLQHPASLTLDPQILSLKEFALTTKAGTITSNIEISQNKLKGTINGSTELSSILQYFPDPPSLSGDVEAHITLSGTLESPAINGSCLLQNGSFYLQKLGAALHNLTGSLTIEGNQVTLTKATATDDDKGNVTATGNILLDPAENLPFVLDIKFADTILFDQDYGKASFDGAINLSGDITSATLKGSAACNTAKFTLPNQSPATVNHVEVTYINTPEGSPLPQAQAITPTGSRWPLTFDLVISFPKNLEIDAKDLTSTWKGDLAIKGNTGAPQFIGDLKIVEGKYSFNGKPLVLEEGTISFNGDIEKRTTLYVIANRDLDEVNIDIILKGPVKNPSITFRSNPPLPQREILSWLLFNTGTSEISSFQGSQLSESITNLSASGGSQGADVLTKIRTTLGIDRLEIGRCGTGDDSQMSLQVGKYITDNVLVCINKREVNSVAIEAAITKKFKLQAQVSDDSQGQLLLKWKRDY